LLGYSMMLSFSPELSASQAQWQQNLHKAERFLYTDDKPKAVIVGTSLAARLRLERVAGYENVSFSGLSIFDGLSVLRHKDKLPSVVYIETNGLLRTSDRNFSETLFAPVPFLLRRRVMALRADKQPLALIGQSFGIALRKRGRQIKHEVFGISSSM